jgi:ATP-dependent helicase HrpA
VIEEGEDFLNLFEVFMIDEAHELKKQSMVILAILRNLLKDPRSNQKLIVTSATLDSKLFENYFSEEGFNLDYQLIEAVTPTYDVQVHYTNFPDLEASLVENTTAHLKVIFDHIRRHFCTDEYQKKPNVLVFLPSVKDIKQIKEAIEEIDEGEGFKRIKETINFVVEELHGALKPSEKSRVIQHNHQHSDLVRVILATKIAETAITLQNIYYVLDSGLEREYYYDEITKMSFIKEIRISKSSAEQRKGRAGRVGDGFCFKMYKEEEEIKFNDNKVPEILRNDIADIVLIQTELKHLFDFSHLLYSKELEIHRISGITEELKRVGALDTVSDKQQLTNKGKIMLKMSCTPIVSAFLVECYTMGAFNYGVIAASALETGKGIFKDTENLHQYSMTRTRDNSTNITQLGDLGLIIDLVNKHGQTRENERRVLYNELQITEKEFHQLLSKIEEISK